MRILMAGGGTGGHLYPGIAVARELVRRDPSREVSFVGTADGIEARVVPREGFELDLIRVAGLKGKSRGALLRGLWLLPRAALDAWRVISRRRPAVVVGVGGFASGPVLLLAAWRGIPTLLLEQNAMPGITNRLLARWVRAAAVNFEEALGYFPRVGFVAGNPVRPEFLAGSGEAHAQRDSPLDAARVLIFGGSQGAHAINVAMVEAASRLVAAGVGVAITHQTGERDLDLVRDAYRRAGLEARVEAFLYEIDREMSAADLVVCRAGATTLAEIAALGRPAVLVPLPTATDDHQRRNAEVLVSKGAAVVIEQRDLTGERLATTLLELARDGDRRARMAEAARALARPHAAAAIADRIEALAGMRTDGETKVQ
ncbi:MAG: undecaprenyldiphospho-muramoylpentapeptide beta-N-acetylglucosaminyltransferase [Vicinamibacterales bacterium]|nr:undecaprenyldiphospho-muramoylpentapeptide beta-N-acetylglucosaminyltransferase [Vicinamibacterales bacterium]